MTDRKPIEEKNLDGYGNPIIPWADLHDALSRLHEAEIKFYLGTLRPDGRLHAAGVGPVWFDGDFYICTGLNTQKAKNLAFHPNCTLSAGLPLFDVTMEGSAVQVKDLETVAKLAEVFRQGGWPTEATGDALTAPYSAPSAGSAPWHLFRFTFDTVYALKLDELGGATRWKFV